MPVEITSVGNVEAISTVSVRSQVAGPLLEVHFKEGDFVHKGQLLLTIDPRPYQAQVEAAKGAIVRDQADEKQAEASLAKDSAQEAYARGEAQRYATRWRRASFPRDCGTDEVQWWLEACGGRGNRQARASIARSGHIECGKSAAQLRIYSPIDGRRDCYAKAGNLLKASDVPSPSSIRSARLM
jgi:multidrug efflux system membrane fusion protein